MSTNNDTNLDHILDKVKEGWLARSKEWEVAGDIEPYCDEHLGLRMKRVCVARLGDDEHNLGLYAFDHEWACPNANCQRHYDPFFYRGYYTYPASNGSAEPSAPRCERHHPRPMYVARVGSGRRWKCPNHQCREDRPVLAESIAYEEPEMEVHPVPWRPKDEEKKAREMSIFKAFAQVSAQPFESPESKPPPHPDICCTNAGATYWFELGEIVDEEAAENLSPKGKAARRDFAFDRETTLRALIEKKKTKTYKTDGRPVDLILHFSRRFGNSCAAGIACNTLKDQLTSLTTDGPFRRVWVFDSDGSRIVRMIEQPVPNAD